VLDGKVIAGLFTEREIIKVVKNSDTPSLVDAFMTRDPIVADADLSLEEASKLMRDLGIRRIPLVKGDSLVGIITAADIVKYLRRYAERGERQDRAIAVGTRDNGIQKNRNFTCIREKNRGNNNGEGPTVLVDSLIAVNPV